MSRHQSPNLEHQKEHLVQDITTATISNEEVVLQQPQETTMKKKTKKNKSKAHRQRQQQQQLTTADTSTKRKRVVISTADIPTSVSTISLMQPSTKRTRATDATTITTILNEKPDYLHVTDQVFKNMLLTTLKGVEEHTVLTLLDTPEKLQCIRTYTHLIQNVFYLKMKLEFWKEYYTIVIRLETDSKKMSKQILKTYNLDRIQFIRSKNVLKRQQTLNEQLNQIEHELNEYKQQAVNMNRLSNIIPAFVRQKQRQLSVNFKRKISLLEFNVSDFCSLQAFYDLKPTEDQVNSAKLIWKTTMNQQQKEEQLAILKQRIYIKRLPPSFDLADHTIDPNAEQMLRNLDLSTEVRAQLSSQREKIISRFKYDLISNEILIIEEFIRTYANLIATEKKRLTDAAQGQVPLPKALIEILNAITARQSIIIKRAHLNIKHKLSFFDYAPTVANETVGANL